MGRTGAGPHRKLLRHKGNRENDQHAAGEIDLEDLQAQFDAEDMAKEREAVRKTTEKAKRLAAMLERYGMKYTDLLELEVMRQALGEMGHQILMGYHRGEGWPDGT